MSTPTRWNPPTLADVHAAAPRATAAAGAGGGSPTAGNTPEETATVQCHCGRWMPSDMMVDVRRLPSALRLGHGRGPMRETEADYLCDACRARMVAAGRTSLSGLAAALGAPAATVAKLRARERGGNVTA